MALCISRRMTNTVIASLPRPASPRAPGSLRRLDELGQRVLVGARGVGEALARGPDVDLVVERDDAVVAQRRLARLEQNLLSRLVVDGGERLVELRVHLRVAVAAAVRRAPALVRRRRREDRLERVRGLA